MERDITKASSNDAAPQTPVEDSPLLISSEEFQRQLDRWIEDNPDLDDVCPILRRPDWLSPPREPNLFERLLTSFMKRVGRH